MPTVRVMRLRIVALLVAVVAGCAHASGRGAHGEDRPVVTDVRLVGNEAIESDAIREGLGTEETGRWPWSERRRVDPLVLANDERRIETLYRLRGYYSAQVEHELEPTGRDRVRVVFRIREGAPTRVERVERTGVEALPPEVREAALASLPIGPGDVMRYEAYDAARELVEARLRAAGYAKAEVDGRVDVYPERHEAVVTLQASPGALHRYGDLRVEGLAAIPADPLLAIVRRVLPRGQRFSPSAVEEAQSRLTELGAFRSVRLSMGAPPEGGGLAPVVLRVEELPVHSVVIGGGVGVEQNVQQIRAVVEYGNTSFLGGARRLSWENELSLQFLPSFFDRDRTGLSAESALELTQPEILDRTSLGVRAGYERAFREAYEANVVSARVGLGHRLARGVRVVPALSLERFLGFSARRPAGAAPLPLVLGCPEPCQLAYVSLDLIVDHRDDPVATRRGHMLLGGTRYGFPLPNGGFHYVRVEPEARWYAPLGRRLTLATRAKLGALFAVGDSADSPLPHRFFGGGEGGHRGFGAEQLAPIVEDASGGFVPIGGDGLWLLTAELRYRASARWELVSFADWGDVTVEPLDLDPGSAHLALGAGARLFTPVGPVRLDVSYRLPRRMRVALDTGAAVETRARDYLAFFLSIGEAF